MVERAAPASACGFPALDLSVKRSDPLSCPSTAAQADGRANGRHVVDLGVWSHGHERPVARRGLANTKAGLNCVGGEGPYKEGVRILPRRERWKTWCRRQWGCSRSPSANWRKVLGSLP